MKIRINNEYQFFKNLIAVHPLFYRDAGDTQKDDEKCIMI